MSKKIKDLATESPTCLVGLPRTEWYLTLKKVKPQSDAVIEQMRVDLVDGVTKSGADEVYVEREQVLLMCDLSTESAKDKSPEKPTAAS